MTLEKSIPPKFLVTWVLTAYQMSEAKRKSKYDRLLVTRLVTFLVDDHLISKWMISLQIKQIIMKNWKFFTCEINPLTNIFVIIPSES